MGCTKGGREIRRRRSARGCVVALLLAIVLLVMSSALAALSSVIRARANPQSPFPLWTNPPNRPARANLMQGVAGGLTVVGAVLLVQVVGVTGLLVIIPVWLPATVVMLRHNRHLAA